MVVEKATEIGKRVLDGDEVADDELSRFLTARWGFHERHRGRTIWAANAHEPWPLRRAELLGIRASGSAAVRVRLVDPPERDRARLRAGKPASPRPDASPDTLATLRQRWMETR